MSPEDIDTLTLADLEVIAARFGGAVQTIRDAQALFGSRPPPRLEPRAQQAPAVGPIVHWQPTAEPEEPLPHLEAKKAERMAYLRDMRQAPERVAKLEQFKHDGEPDARDASATDAET